jgi:hypothetical protein
VSALKTSTVQALPAAPTMGGGGTHCGDTGEITASYGNGGNSIMWTDDGTNVTPRSVGVGTATYYAVTFSANGCYSVAASVTVSIRQGSGVGYAPDPICGCKYGAVLCDQPICLAATSHEIDRDCVPNSGYRYVDLADACGRIFATDLKREDECCLGACSHPHADPTCKTDPNANHLHDDQGVIDEQMCKQFYLTYGGTYNRVWMSYTAGTCDVWGCH